MKKPSIHFTVTSPDPHTHLFHVLLRIERPQAQQLLMLPVWIPGSYLIREFSGHLQCLYAQQGKQTCVVHQLDKHRWQINCKANRALEISYQVYAHDHSVRAAWLDAERGFFNASSVCLMVDGQTDCEQHITIDAPSRHWQLATGLSPVRVDQKGFGLYVAPDYDTLADCPVEMGTFWSADFVVCGVPHRFVVAHSLPTFDGARLVKDVRRICKTIMHFWHGERATAKQIPFDRYVFMLNAVGDGYGGLEHANSTALIASRKHLPCLGQSPGDDYTTLLGLISHEYFHTWNVKRLKPASFLSYDYARENYTDLLWFFEGLTSYYDDLLLLRAGCIDLKGYARQLQKTLDSVRNSPGRLIQSVAQASFDAWTKYYRPDANTPNATVSYYTKGALIGLCLDLTLRREGKTTLDAVMRVLYTRCYATALRGITEQDVRTVLQELGGRSFVKEINAWVHGTDELPLQALLQKTDIRIVKEKAELSQQWGLRCKEGGSILVQIVLRGSAAEASGLTAGDEWLGVEVENGISSALSAWRVSTLAEVQSCLAPVSTLSKKNKSDKAPRSFAIVSRDRRLLRLPLKIPDQEKQSYWKLQERAQSFSQASGKGAFSWPFR